MTLLLGVKELENAPLEKFILGKPFDSPHLFVENKRIEFSFISSCLFPHKEALLLNSLGMTDIKIKLLRK
jgi:hypothetical protein